MLFTPTSLPGPVIVALEERSDERGFFARTFDREEFVAAGLSPVVEQSNFSFNHRAGTLRGMHWQLEPASEAKLIRCTRGAIFDVAADVRPDSVTYLQHVSVELSAENRLALYVPPSFAHGFITLIDNTEVTYNVSAPYSPASERGMRYDDPALGIDWPLAVTTISEKDLSWPPLKVASGFSEQH
jgi:dTDP-4-dehydrorhamnose 3,5-epimerase